MNDGKFQWDDKKASSNYAKHKISFEMACGAFSDPFFIDWLDDNENGCEQRFSMIGMSEERLLFIAYTLRNDCVRIISARRATKIERRLYHGEN